MTEWRDIPGFTGYQVSSAGHVRSKRFPDRNLRPNTRGSRHQTVTLFTPTGRRWVRVHVLVLLAFVGPKPDWAECVRHLNDVADDNRLENLAYGTYSENGLDAVRNGVHNNTRKTACPFGHPYDEENTYREGSKRHCRTCRTDRNHARWHPEDPRVAYLFGGDSVNEGQARRWRLTHTSYTPEGTVR